MVSQEIETRFWLGTTRMTGMSQGQSTQYVLRRLIELNLLVSRVNSTFHVLRTDCVPVQAQRGVIGPGSWMSQSPAPREDEHR